MGRRVAEQPGRWSPADTLSVLRIPLAVAFVLAPGAGVRFAILAAAAASDLLDGYLARRWGGSRLGPVFDPIADKLFMAAAFGVVAFSGRLQFYEVAGVLVRDLWATLAFLATLRRKEPAAIPARAGGKAVTLAQVLTLVAFLADSALLRPLAWATAGMGLYAVYDYQRVASREARRLRPAPRDPSGPAPGST